MTTLTVAGDGPLESKLKEHAASLGLGPSVRFPGFLQQPQLKEEFEQAHIFVHPSQMGADGNREGIPNALLEAMAQGLPVVATQHGGIPEAVENGVSGRLLDEGDAAGIAAALLDYFQQPEMLRAAGRAARLAAERSYSQEKQVEAISRLYGQGLAVLRRVAVVIAPMQFPFRSFLAVVGRWLAGGHRRSHCSGQRPAESAHH